MKSFEQFINEKLNKRVVVNDIDAFKRQDVAKFNRFVVGAVVFGSERLPRTLVVDKNFKFDQKIGGDKTIARIVNSASSLSGSSIDNATLAKFNLKTGAMWLAEDDVEGKIVWGKGFKFKNLFISNVARLKKIGWRGIEDLDSSASDNDMIGLSDTQKEE